ncbi:MAG: TauD/TfdA family dioxygenase [Pseudomonadales bacterium]|nr:TauD/TfdA family dioxygenase [Pseudomonadales bacterium]
MKISITRSGQACGATVQGVDLSVELDSSTIATLREAWLAHKVLVFPGQKLTTEDLERFTLYFGPFGHDPFIEPIVGHPHVIAVQRAADETGPIFADSAWHTDWSFQKTPPAGTCLYGITIPPQGGDTLFANQQLALQKMPATLRSKLEGKRALHTARLAYSPQGVYGDTAKQTMSMKFSPSDEATAEQYHPLIRIHPETGEEVLFGALGYMLGVEGMPEDQALELLSELHNWQTREEFQYRHRWEANSLLMWDNRSVLHCAQGGYDGYARLLHRTTIGERARAS